LINGSGDEGSAGYEWGATEMSRYLIKSRLELNVIYVKLNLIKQAVRDIPPAALAVLAFHWHIKKERKVL